MFFKSPILTVVFLLCASLLSGTTTAILQLGRTQAREVFKKHRALFFFQHFMRPLFGKKGWEGLFFALSTTKHILQLCYASSALIFLLYTPPLQHLLQENPAGELSWLLIAALFIIAIYLLVDFFTNLLGSLNPIVFFKVFSPFSSSLLTLFSPITLPLFKLFNLFLPTSFKNKTFSASFQMKDKLLDIINESEISSYFDAHDQKLLLAVANFKDRIAREVMVPRIDISILDATTSIEEAAKTFLEDGFSRVPVYRESVDHIIGVLLYKDVLAAYTHKEDISAPVETLIKPVLYTPETKKISHLLQEFRHKQSHLAIVVDEYGGTEGIVTIEDILEELVGEIADEYDTQEDILFTVLPSGGWVVDAKMTIIDIEEELGISIDQSPEYDTLGGYIFHKAGSIPTKGWRLHHDAFELEVLSSTEKSVEKVKITPCNSEDIFSD